MIKMKALLAPMPQLPLVPTGGATVRNCTAYWQAGCVAVAVGTSVVNEEPMTRNDWQAISQRAHAYVQSIRSVKT